MFFCSCQSLTVDTVSGKSGKMLWNWESDYPAPNNIGMGRGSSAAITVFDLKTSEANKKLLMATDGWLYEFTFNHLGFLSERKVKTGTVNSSDCLIIADLDGKGKHHLLLKDAYHTIWAYDRDLNLSWKVKKPGGYLLAHRIIAEDLNNDGKDEILAGATILNGSGEVISTLKTNTVKLWYGAHIDGIVPIRQNDEWYISVTYCDGLGVAIFDSKGNLQWEITGEHFEYLVGGYFFNTPQFKNDFQLISKIHYKEGNPQIMINQDGTYLGSYDPASAFFSADWDGDGYHEIFTQSPASIISGNRKIAEILIPGDPDANAHTMRVADLVGKDNLFPDGIPDIVVRSIDHANKHFLHIYPNKSGKAPTNYVYPGIGWESSSNYLTKYYEYNRE